MAYAGTSLDPRWDMSNPGQHKFNGQNVGWNTPESMPWLATGQSNPQFKADGYVPQAPGGAPSVLQQNTVAPGRDPRTVADGQVLNNPVITSDGQATTTPAPSPLAGDRPRTYNPGAVYGSNPSSGTSLGALAPSAGDFAAGGSLASPPGPAPTSNVGAGNVQVNLPASSGQMTKLTGQATSEGAGFGQTQEGGAIAGGAGQAMGTGTAVQGGANALPATTATGGTNNTGLGQGGGAPTAATSGPAPADPKYGQTLNYGALAPTGAVTTSAPTGPALPGAPSASNPYGSLAPTTAGVANPYTGDYAQRTIAAGRGAIQNEYEQARQNLQADYARRGLTNAGMSGLEAGDLRTLEAGRAKDLGALDSQAYFNAADKGAAFDMSKAGAQDSFALAKAGGTQGYNAQAFDQWRYGALTPGQVEQQNLANTESNQHIQAFAQEFPSTLQRLQAQGQISSYDAQTAQWVAQNQGWMAALSFLSNLAGGAAKTTSALAGLGVV